VSSLRNDDENAYPLVGKVAIVSPLARGLLSRVRAPCIDPGLCGAVCEGAKAAMARVFGAAAMFLCCLLLAAAPGRTDPVAPAPPLGLMQPFEINKIVRDAGFTPLGLPQREGTTYVLRAIDSRDILMRVVIDARSGAINAVNRFVPARPGGVIGMMPPDGAQGSLRSVPGPPLPPPRKASPYEPLPGLPPESPPHDMPRDHATPADIGGAPTGSTEATVRIPLSPLTAPANTHPVPQGAQPLPRPRPSNLAKLPGKVPKEPAVKPSAAPAAASVAPVAPRRAPTTPKGVPQIATPD
jgi:hypothetical protein